MRHAGWLIAYLRTLRVIETAMTDTHNWGAHSEGAPRQWVASTASVTLLGRFVDQLYCQRLPTPFR